MYVVASVVTSYSPFTLKDAPPTGIPSLLIFAALACSVLTGTNWGHLTLNTLPLAF